MFVFLIWHILSILRDKLSSHKEARADASLWRHGCVTKGCVRANTESDTHLLKLLCINTPTFIITYFCQHHLTRTHTQTQNRCNESTRICSRERAESHGWVSWKYVPCKHNIVQQTHKIYAHALMLTVSQSEGLKRKSCIVLSICKPNPHVIIFSKCPITVMSKIEQLT